ncbi:signal peptide-containing protein [Theileria equi strain WA]|uniref:Signal peptide-containing protein n=1 Tax=Theileria equi strain WA TaxID=1537102 RepID=L0AWD6_THEEQ|nr:signal peptide-containing protein [Theileria equi strain WA]AFZ79860.1 signal peptide-containing protein [Theileria equi strain WA]|eukprot:XP_004829526.1 signal peptide-containing protein [Theileria equi strain WA]
MKILVILCVAYLSGLCSCESLDDIIAKFDGEVAQTKRLLEDAQSSDLPQKLTVSSDPGSVTIPVDVTAEAGGPSGQIPGQQPPGPEPLSIFLLVPTLKMMLVLLVMKKTLFFLVEVQ